MRELPMLTNLLLLLLLGSQRATAIPLGDFYPFGSEAGDTSLPSNDDGSSPPITLELPFRFFDEDFSTFFVSYIYYTHTLLG